MLKLVLVVQSDDSQCELVFDQNAVGVDYFTVSTPTAVTQLYLGLFLEMRLLQVTVIKTRRTSQSKQNSVRSLGDRNTVGIIGIERDIGQKEITRTVRLGQSTNTGSAIRIAPVASTCSKVSVRTGYFGIGRVEEKILNIRDALIIEEFLGDNLNRASDIFKGCPEAGTRQRGKGTIALVVVSRYREGRKFENILVVVLGNQPRGTRHREREQPSKGAADSLFRYHSIHF